MFRSFIEHSAAIEPSGPSLFHPDDASVHNTKLYEGLSSLNPSKHLCDDLEHWIISWPNISTLPR